MPNNGEHNKLSNYLFNIKQNIALQKRSIEQIELLNAKKIKTFLCNNNSIIYK